MEKKKRDSKLKHKQEKEKKLAQKEAKKAKKEAEKDVRHTKCLTQYQSSATTDWNWWFYFLQTMEGSHLSLGMNEGKLCTGSYQKNGTAFYMTAKPVNGLSYGGENWAYQHDTADSDSEMGSRSNDAITGQPPHADEEKGTTCGSGTHSIILDISTTNFVDMVTVKTLKNVSVPRPVSLNHRLLQNNVNKNSYYESFL